MEHNKINVHLEDLILVKDLSKILYGGNPTNRWQPKDRPTSSILEVAFTIDQGYYHEDKFSNLWFIPKEEAEVVFTT